LVEQQFSKIKMKKLFEEFEKPNLSDWKTQLIKELKANKSIDSTSIENEIEELVFQEIYNSKDSVQPTTKRTSNEWQIGVEIVVINEKSANKSALNQLNLGANALNFDISNLNEINLSELLKEIETKYIYTYFTVNKEIQASRVSAWFKDKTPLFIQINTHKNSVNAYEICALGSNITQELGYALAKGKQLLNKDAEAPIHFTFGIGSNFMVEIAKFKAFHILWNKIKLIYQSTSPTLVTAKSGFINKSIHDPYTNLLRQTTEGLSAIFGGVDQLIIQPYDTLTEFGSSTFSERMSINISLILKDEAEINQWFDPLEGSHSIDRFTSTLADKAWEMFQKIEYHGGIDSEDSNTFLTDEIKRIRYKRLDNAKNTKSIYVGINKFINTNETLQNWKITSDNFLLGMTPLVIEKEINE
jgi:methylmalonyl-CoA mutase